MTNLKLHRDEEQATDAPKARKGPSAAPRADQDRVLAFPTGNIRRQALVAGRVNRSAASGHDFQPRDPNSTPSDAVSSDELIAGIERTLDSMQRRLDRVRRDVEHTLKFPSPQGSGDEDPPRPRAA